MPLGDPSLRGRREGVHAFGVSFRCQPGSRSARPHPRPSSDRGTADPSLRSGNSTPHAVLGLPSIKVTPQANLNTAPCFFHPLRGLVVNPPSSSGQGFYGPRT